MQDPGELRALFEPKVDKEAARFVIYSPECTERLRYTCDFIFRQVLQVCFRLTDDQHCQPGKGEFLINYSRHHIEGVFRIKPHPFLSSGEMLPRRAEPFFRNGQIYFFHNSENPGGLDFDLFAAVFYFISRHEEWQDFSADLHQRFEASESILYQKNFLGRPVVDQWILEFNLALRKVYKELKFPEKNFKVISTIDVDNVYAYRGKGFARSLGGALKDLLRLDFSAVLERMLVLAGAKNDPFDVYTMLSDFTAASRIPAVFFFLMRHNTRYDRTLDPAKPAFKKLFARLKKVWIGLHPSYHTASDADLLRSEAELLSSLSGQAPFCARQHYLRFDIRTTPKHLMAAGIEVDFSMGFASECGFRAGTSHPFYYYDFTAEKATQLLFVPFCAMDGVFTVYKKTDTRSALVALLALAAEIKNSGGYFVSVFHERTFSNRLYKGYGTLYKNLHTKLAEMESL